MFIFDCAGSSLPHRLFSSCRQWGLPLAVAHGLLIVAASPVAEHGLKAEQTSVAAALGLHSTGSTVAHQLSGSVACGIFLDQGLNPDLLHWQADSLPLSHQ